MLIPINLDGAKEIINKVANAPGRVEEGLLQPLKDLNDKTQQMLDVWDKIFEFCDKVGYVFKEIGYIFTHPSELFSALEPWLVTVLLVMIVMKAMGIDNMKYFKLVFVILVLIIMFC